jgi:hypothetical protein
MMPGWYRDYMDKSKILQHFGGETFKIVQIRNEPAGPLNICELFKVQRVIQAELVGTSAQLVPFRSLRKQEPDVYSALFLSLSCSLSVMW